MGLSAGRAFAVGDLSANLTQGINLVNACYARAVVACGHVLFHASGVSWAGASALLAGPPGAGKSTAALHLVEAGFGFLSNDRVLARRDPSSVEVLGYPKQPRVNPGTLLHHPRLSALLEDTDRQALLSLPAAELWRLEPKRDVDLDAIYGKGTVDLRGRARAPVILKWRPPGRAAGLGAPPHAERSDGGSPALSEGPRNLRPRPPGSRTGRGRPPRALRGHPRGGGADRGQRGGADFAALVDLVGELLGQ
jgi:HprK-related kinase B